MATDLADFLRARLDEDEHYLCVMTEVGKRKAETATPQDEADAYGFAISILSDPEATKILEQWCDGTVLPPNHNDRLLAEIAAKRAILELHREVPAHDIDWSSCAECRTQTYPCGTLQRIAPIYSEHPDYRPEWKP